MSNVLADIVLVLTTACLLYIAWEQVRDRAYSRRDVRVRLLNLSVMKFLQTLAAGSNRITFRSEQHVMIYTGTEDKTWIIQANEDQCYHATLLHVTVLQHKRRVIVELRDSEQVLLHTHEPRTNEIPAVLQAQILSLCCLSKGRA